MERNKKSSKMPEKQKRKKSSKFKLSTKKVITIADLLTSEEVGKLLDDLIADRAKVESLIIVATLEDGMTKTCFANLSPAEVFFALEDFKTRLLLENLDRDE